ncbi:O-antigen ligase family protein [Herpetosiphon gulosus]|uniref:O-antigen ligase-related domain-containing protein n=1 Tax=Herpetosiphon gulosus TaxID=1973496 RepID=A0ABP9X2P3_9CHLR
MQRHALTWRSVQPLDWLLASLGLAGVAIITLLPFTQAATLIICGMLLVCMLIQPAVGLSLTVATVMLQELLSFPLGLTATHVIGIMALGAWLLYGMAQRKIIIDTTLLVPWSLFLMALLLSAGLTEYNAVDALKQVVRWFMAFLAFVVTVATITTPKRAIGLIAVMFTVGVIEALIGIQQYRVGAGPFAIGETVRAYGTIGKPNTFAGFLELMWPMTLSVALGLLWFWWQQRQRWHYLLGSALSAGASLIILAAIGVSFSRGAWIGIMGALVVMLLAVDRRRALPLIGLGGILLLAIISQPELFPPVITERISSLTNNLRIFDAGRVTVTDENFAVVERMAHWQAGANMFLAHPVLGVGPDNFNRAYPEFFVGRWSESQGHSHNYYIHIAAEAGILGLIAYLVLIAAVYRQAYLAIQATRGTVWQMVAIGCCGIITAIQLHNVFDNLHVLNFGIHLSAVWALCVVLTQRQGWRA